MIIHNVMEDLVYDEVNKLFDEAEEKKKTGLHAAVCNAELTPCAMYSTGLNHDI